MSGGIKYPYVLVTAMLCALVAISPSSARAQQAQPKLRLSFADGYIPSFPQKREMNALFRPELVRLRKILLKRNRNGEDLPCSTQILKEAKWLMNYTNKKERLKRRLKDLAHSLTIADQKYAGEQSDVDGSWVYITARREYGTAGDVQVVDVVDRNCRVHGIDNLYIAGSSVFPTSGYVNPTLTIVALALRLSDAMIE